LGWARQLAGLLVSLGALLVLYWSSVRDLVGVWSASDAYRFLYLILPVSLFIIWSRRERLKRVDPKLRLWAVIPLAVFAGLWFVSRSAVLSVGEHIALVGMVQSLLLLFLGGRAFQVLFFPFMLLWMMVPLGDLVATPLAALTLELAKPVLGLLGRDGPSDAVILVVQECPTLPFVVGNLVITLVFANLAYRRFHRQALLVVASVPVAVFANLVRIVAVLLITDWTGGKIDLVADHRAFGWGVFAVAVLLELALAARFAEPQTSMSALAKLEPRFAKRQSRRSIGACMVIAIGIMALPEAWATYGTSQALAGQAGEACGPDRLFGRAAMPGDWQPAYGAAPDLQDKGQVMTPRGPVDIHVVYYRRQSPGHELIAWENRPYDGAQWQFHEAVSGPSALARRMPEPDAIRLRNTAGDRRLVWTWYWVDGQFTGDPLAAKMRQAIAALEGTPGSGALMLSVAETGDPAGARLTLKAALKEMGDPAALMARAAEAACAAPGR